MGEQKTSTRSRVRAAAIVIAAAFAVFAVWSLWQSHRQQDLSGTIPPEGRMYNPRHDGMSLVVPAPLYPLSRVVSFRVVPVSKDGEGVLHLLLVTSDAPRKVADWYLDKWRAYGVSEDESAGGKVEYRFVVHARGRTAAVEIWGAGFEGDELVKRLQSPVPTPTSDKETKVLLSVPWTKEAG